MVISSVNEVAENCDGVLYWMSRDQRIQDNWAVLYAQRTAIKCKVPLHICFCLVPKFLEATIRHYDFLLKGLQEVEKDCKKLNINFHLLLGKADEVLPIFVKKNKIGAVVTDFSPLREPRQWLESLKGKLPNGVGICQVDAHNVIPCWQTSNKQEYNARTIRTKIHNQLSQFLTGFPLVIIHPYNSKMEFKHNDWTAARNSLQVNMEVAEVEWATPGSEAGLKMLFEFCNNRLRDYYEIRNDPMHDGLSNISPWLHFGQVSAQRCILEVSRYKEKWKESAESFIEEALVRRELADNFCYYNTNYDNFEGGTSWAQKTLNDHRKDPRHPVYTLEELEDARTSDDLWNAAQIQMMQDGKMHGFLRMYWAKKILEWTNSPEEALKISIYLNDKYELDGRDPNGYVGCMWSIVGVHDQGWAERPIFGKIRYMNYNGCKRKFNVPGFVAKYNSVRQSD